MRVGVLGGGPAGAAAALNLARGGAEVELFHPQRRGEKPCGGAVPSFLLDEIEGFEARALPAIDVRQAVLEGAAGDSVELEISGLSIFRRADFDAALVEAARNSGARITALKARQLKWLQERPQIGTDSGLQPFDWLIGADGARGLARRSLGLTPVGESVGLGASLPGVGADVLVLGFPDLADAYCWVFPRPGGCSVGIAYSSEKLSHGAARVCLDGFLERHLGKPLGGFEGTRYRYPIPVFGGWVAAAVARGIESRVLLVGDAAAVADPLTREGIRYSVWSGQWAAASLLEDRPAAYGGELVGRLQADLNRAHRARELFFEGPIGQWMIPVCRRHPGVRRVLADLLSCQQGYVGLRRRLLSAAFNVRRRSDSPSEP